MELSYKRQHNESYMVIEDKGINNSYEEKMIGINPIKALLPYKVIEMDGKKYNYYNISKKISLRDFFEDEETDKALIQKFFIHLNIGLEEISSYLIDTEHILLSPDTIYVEKAGESLGVYLCYYRDNAESVQDQVRGLLEWLTTISAKNSYEIYEASLKKDFTITELIELLDYSEEAALAEEEHYECVPREIEVQEVILEDDEPFEPEEPKMFTGIISSAFEKLFRIKADSSEKLHKYREDFIVEPDLQLTEPTVLIKQSDLKCMGKLIYDGDGFEENYMISAETFKIGSGEENHGRLHSRGVSRSHAKIVKKEDGFFIEDMNSLNGTFVNGKSVCYKMPVKLKPMDQVLFGDVSYVFM